MLEEDGNAELSTEIDTDFGNHPVDIDAIASALEVDDHISQEELLQALFQSNVVPEAERDNYERLPTHSLRLSRLREAYRKKQSSQAIQYLGMRNKIKIDSDLHIPSDDDHLLWRLNDHSLDYILVVSGHVGFWAATPNVPVDHNFVLSLDLSQPYRDYKGKYGKLGFDPKGRMLYIGKCKNDDVWLAMAPWEFIDGGDEGCPAGHVTGDTRLSKRHYRMIVMFFAYHLESISDRGFTCHNPYGASLDDPDSDFGIHTNIMDCDVNLKLRLVDVRHLNHRIEMDWTEWVEEAPSAWKEDGFLLKHVPITVTSRYGQDQPICALDSRDNEARNWHEERDYRKIRFVSVGLATHVSAKQVDDWVPIDEEEILAENEKIYDHWDADIREEIDDLHSLPLADENGREMRIYSSDGRKIARRGMHVAPGTICCGILVNLRTITSVFRTEENDLEMEEDSEEDLDDEDRPTGESSRVSLSVYPQAFLRDYGHIQARGPIQLMQPIIESINSSFADDRQEVDLSSDGLGYPRSICTPVTAISTQMYNRMFHRAASQAGALDVQRGRLTAALSGGGATTTKGKRTAQLLRRYCNAKLPHTRFTERVNIADCPNSLRVESVYVVDMLQMPEHDRNGRTLYRKLICSLVDAWSNTEVSDRLKNHLLVLTPDVIPDIYNWTTYGICTLLGKIYRQEISAIQSGRIANPYLLEFACALERLLAYAHTGNAKVLSTAVMKPLFMIQSVLTMGFPTIMKAIYHEPFQNATQFSIQEDLWPLNKSSKGPAICSKRSQIITYDEAHYLRYETEFRIRHIRFVKDTFRERISQSISNESVREAVAIADVAFNMFLNDVKSIVRAGVEDDIAKSRTQSDNLRASTLASKSRSKLLKDWLGLGRSLLDYKNDNYAHLLRIIVSDSDQIVHGLPGSHNNEFSTLEFSQMLYDMIHFPTRTPLGAPILPKGAFWPSLNVAVNHILPLAPVNPDKFVVHVFRITVEHLGIRFIPWSITHTGPGRRNRTPVWNSWATLGKDDSRRHVDAIVLRPEEALHKAAVDAQNAAMGRDVNISWNLADVKLRDINDFIHHGNLPSDWVIPSQATDYVKETYEYVRDSYNNRNDLHKLALLVSIILGRCLPNIHAPTDTASLLKNATSRSQTRNIVRSLSWISKNKVKGSKDSRIHICMFVSYIIALYDPNSPLRKYMAQHDGNVGNLWSDKHRPKGVVPFTLLRVGLVWGEGPKSYASGRFNRNWGLLPLSDLSNMLKDLLKKISCPPFGVGDALVTLLGQNKADEVATRENVTLRSVVGTKRPGTSLLSDEPPSQRSRH